MVQGCPARACGGGGQQSLPHSLQMVPARPQESLRCSLVTKKQAWSAWNGAEAAILENFQKIYLINVPKKL